MKNDFPPEMKKGLNALRSRVRLIQFWRGFWAVFLALVGGLIVVTGLDYFFAPLKPAARWILFFLWLAVVFQTAWKMLVKPLSRKISLVQIARWIEIRHPEIDERVSTAMQLAPDFGGVSSELLRELTSQATTDMTQINPKAEVSSKKVRPWLWPAAILGLVVLALLAIFPQEYGRLITRAFTPYQESGNAGAVKFTITPGDVEVMAGEEVILNFAYDGEDALVFVKTNEAGESIAETLVPNSVTEGVKNYRYQLASAEKTFRYHAVAGRAESDHFKVTVWPLPSLEKIRVRTTFPTYTDLPPREMALQKNVEALAHSDIELSGLANTQTESGRLLIDGKEVGEVKIDSLAAGGKIRTTWKMEPEMNHLAQIMLKHRLGHEFEVARFLAVALPDEAPVVTLISPLEKKLRLRPNEKISLIYHVSEQIGVARAELEMKVNGRSLLDKNLVLPEKIKGGEEIQLWQGEAAISLGALLEENPGTNHLEMRVKVSDTRPPDFAGSGVGFSEWIIVEIDRHAESLARQEHLAQRSDINETIQEAIKDTQEAVQKMEQQREALKKEELSENAAKELEKAREKLNGAEEKLAQLEERMEKSVQAHRQEDVAEARKKMAEAREKMEQAPLQDSEEARKEKLDESRESAHEAIAKLEETRREMEKDNQRLDDLIHLEELSREQEDLARRAESEAQKNHNNESPKPPSQEFKQDQAQVENRLREQISKSPEAMAAALEKQAEQATKLQEKAKALSQEQASLKEAAQQLAQSEERAAEADLAQAQENLAEVIRENVARQQEEILKKADEVLHDLREQGSEAANEFPEAMSKGKESLEAAAQQDDRAAAETAKKAAEVFQEAAEMGKNEPAQTELTESAEPEKNAPLEGVAAAAQEAMQELARKQEQVVEALEALAKGDSNKALENLQKMQAEAVAEFSEEVANSPQIQGETSEMAQAKAQTKEGAQQSEQAAEKQSEGKSAQSAENNEQAEKSLAQASETLGRAAEKLEQQAADADAQNEPESLTTPAEEMAEAFQQASQAADAESQAQAAESAQKASEALQQAAKQARQAMAQGQKGAQAQKKQAQAAAESLHKPSPQESDQLARPAQADQGIPPELAKLGLSLSDWEKIKENLRSNTASGGGTSVPGDYRELVQDYFQQLSEAK